MCASADLDHFKVFFADAAIRTNKILGNVLPCGARRDAVSLEPFRFVIDEPTDDALPLPHR